MPFCTNCGRENPGDARFCSGCGTALGAEPPAPTREVRKTVTVVFTDVTGSTSLGERLDPESLRRVMSRYFAEMRAVLERHGGTVEKFIGDAVMAVFGIPVLHEDDSLRAVRAADEMRQALEALNDELERSFGVRIQVRTGVNTGEVVTGDPSQGHAFATGDAVNVAARLEQAAQAGEILIGDETFRLVKDAVRVEPVEPLALKGKSERVRVHRLLEVLPDTLGHVRRLDSPIVGREREQAFLLQAFERAASDRACHLLTVLGPAGIGKSRLVEELVHAVEEEATVLRGRCLSYGEGITFWPLAEAVREAAGLVGGEDPAEARARLAALVEEEEDAELIAARVAALLGLGETTGGTQESFWAVRRLLESLARHRRLVIVFDDLHWAEPTFLDLVDHVAEWSREAPILLVCPARPELLDARPSWAGGKLNATSLLLEPLAEEESARLIENLLGRTGLDLQVRSRIAEVAEGNPLFVEEMVSMLIDDGLLARRNGHWTPTADLSGLAVPPSIHALLAARLDRLEEDQRAVMERAAIEGRVFHLSALRELSDGGAPDLNDRLMALVRKELIRPERSDFRGEDAFRFRHILIREAAYGGLPKESRAELHQRFAGWLERRAGERAAEYDEIIGYHLEQSHRYRRELGALDEGARAVAERGGSRLVAAGRRALARGDVAAARNLLARATDLLPDDASERPAALLDYGEALREAGDLAAARSVLNGALKAATARGDERVQAHALIDGLVLQTLTDPEFRTDELLDAATRTISGLEEHNDALGLAKAWRAVAEVHLTRCRWGASAEALELARKYAAESRAEALLAETYSVLATCHYYGPTPVEEAVRRCEELLEAARDRRIVEATIRSYLGGFRAMQGNIDGARELLTFARRGFEELGHRFGLAAYTAVAGEAELLAGEAVRAEDELRRGYEMFEAMGETGVLSTLAAFLAEAIYAQGRYEEAERFTLTSEEAAAEEDAASQVSWRLTRAKVLARRAENAGAERLAREAVEIAAETDFLGLRGAALLARAEVLSLAGRPQEVAPLVEEALGLFRQKGNVAAAARAEWLRAEWEAGAPAA